MAILGADPDQLESTATRVLARADDYDDACNQIAYWLRRMDWQGPEADHFHAMFESQIRPQLGAAAACLRQAASELRTQAAAQTKISQNPTELGTQPQQEFAAVAEALAAAAVSLGGFTGGQINTDEDSRWGGMANAIIDLIRPPMPGIRPVPLRELTGLLGVAGTAAGFAGFSDLAYMRYAKNTVPALGPRLPEFGVTRWIGSRAGTALGVAGAGLGLVNLPGHVDEFGDVWERIQESSHLQPEDAADLLDATADTILDSAAIIGFGPLLPVSLGMTAFGYGMKAGAQLDTPIIWACDNVVYPLWRDGKEAFGAAVEGLTDYVTDVGGAVVDGLEDVGGAVVGGAKKVIGALNPFD